MADLFIVKTYVDVCYFAGLDFIIWLKGVLVLIKFGAFYNDLAYK